MRYRALDENGDSTFGQGSANFLVNSPEAAGQAVETRLQLMQNSWFLDLTAGTPYDEIIGPGKLATADAAIREVILETQAITNDGLVNIINKIQKYSSSVDPKRNFTVSATIDTIFGQIVIATVFTPGNSQ